MSTETQPDCYLAIVEVDGVTTVQRHCESLGGGGGGPAFTDSTPGPASGFHQPAEGAIVGGTVQLDGWSLDDDGGVTGTLGFWLDGQPALVTGATYGEHDATACSGRLDPACPYVGFSGALDTTVLADGAHTIELVTSETAPERPTPGYAETTFVVDNTQPTAAITAPTYGAPYRERSRSPPPPRTRTGSTWCRSTWTGRIRRPTPRRPTPSLGIQRAGRTAATL